MLSISSRHRFRTLVGSVAVVGASIASSASVANAQGPPPLVFGNDRRMISAVVGPDTSSVASGASFTGTERWEFRMTNNDGPLTGAQVIAQSGYDLTDTSHFRFQGSIESPSGPPAPPQPVNCTVTTSQATCPPGGAALAAGQAIGIIANDAGTQLPWLAPGIPKPMTPGFDSAVHETAFSSGTAHLDVLATLQDASRYGGNNPPQLQIRIDGNVVPGSGTVTSSNGAVVPPCPTPGGPPPAPGVTCFNAMYQQPLCRDSHQFGASASFFLDSPQLGLTYDFGSTQAVTPTCPNPPARPHVSVDAAAFGCSQLGCQPPQSSVNSVTVPDADLQGSVTFREDQASPDGGVQTEWIVDYLPILVTFPTGGDFAIGDASAALGNHVVFWGAQWSIANGLSGGSAPASFKGFENSDAAPSCGNSWTASPGDTSNPPATVPLLMGMIVTSNVSKSASTISGNVVHIVVVQTDPGYQPDPAFPGTGTVVGQIC